MGLQILSVVPALDVLLVEVFQKYRHGLCRQPRSASPMPPRDFDALRFLGTLGWVPLQSRLQLRRLHALCGKGLTAARRGYLDIALWNYKLANERLHCLEGSTRTAWLLGASTYYAGVAYLDFRRGCVEQAQQSLGRAMDADLELETAGLPVMQMHRIQQGHNLARMDFRLDRRDAAVGLAGGLLAYMESRVEELPYHSHWRAKSLQAVPRSLLHAMIHQIIGETADCIVTGDASTKEWRILIEASRLYREPETAVFPQVQYALNAQYRYLAGDSEGYLRNLEHFFRPGIRHCHLLWYAIMVGFLNFCRALNTHISGQVLDVVLRDSAKWRGMPPLLRGRLDGSASPRTVA